MNSLRVLSSNLIRNSIASRSYYTNRVKKATLYSKISPLGNPKTSVVPTLEDWVKGGNKVSVSELLRIVHDLRRRKRFSHALEVSEWMNKTGICVFSPTEHAVHLDLIGRVHGFVSAESYFNNLREQHKINKTYGALLNCCVRQRKIEQSLSLFQKMKEMGFASSPLTYNDIMCLYTNTCQHDKVFGVLAEMKMNNVTPDNYSYRICINASGVISDFDGMQRALQEMENETLITMDWNTYAVVAKFYVKAGNADEARVFLKKSEERLENKDGTGFNHLISLYASLGDKDEVSRLWDLEKDACKRRINRDYITMLQSLVNLNELEEANKVLKDWESSGNFYDFRVPNVIILGYCKNGLYEKAEAVLEDFTEKGKDVIPNSWGIVAEGYFEKGRVEKALGCVKAACALHVENRNWKPKSILVTGILRWLGDEGSFEDAEAFVGLVRTRVSVNRQMYHAMIKASLREGGGHVDMVLQRMKDDKIDEDEETKRILDTGRLS